MYYIVLKSTDGVLAIPTSKLSQSSSPSTLYDYDKIVLMVPMGRIGTVWVSGLG